MSLFGEKPSIQPGARPTPPTGPEPGAGQGDSAPAANSFPFADAQETESVFLTDATRLWQAVNTASEGIWDWDATVGKSFYSPAYFRLLGLEPDEAIRARLTWVDLVHPDDRRRAHEANQRCASGECDHFEVEFRMRHRDGSWRWILSRGRCLLRDSSGKALRMVGTHIDITEQKRSEAALAEYARLLKAREEELRTRAAQLKEQEQLLASQTQSLRDNERSLLESEAKYRTLFQNATDAVFVETLEGQVIDCNQMACSMFGYSYNELLRTPVSALMPPDVEVRMLRFQEKIRSGANVQVKDNNRRKNGEVFPAEINLQTVNINGQPRVIVTVRDLSEVRYREKVETAIYEISEAVQTSTDLDELYREIHKTIQELMPAENFYIALYDEADDMLSFPYSIDEFDPTPLPHPPGRGLTEYVLRTGQPALITAEKYAVLLRAGEITVVGQPPVDWLGVPLKVGERTIGIMALQSYDPQVRYSSADRDVLVFISNQVASAIQRKRAGDQIGKLNRTLQLISMVNQVLVRAESEDELMQRVCQVLAGTGGYPLAWIGLPEPHAAQIVRPAVVAGEDHGYIQGMQLTWTGQGYTGSLNPAALNAYGAAFLTRAALRSGRPALRQFYPDGAPNTDPAITCGYASAIALPLLSGGQAFGAVHVYAPQVDAFNEEEVALLVQMADDLAYGITALRERKQRQQAVQSLSENEEKYRSVVEHASDGITILRERTISYTNQRLAEMLGWTVSEVTGTCFLDYVAPDSRREMLERVRLRREGSRELFTYTTHLLHKDGHLVVVEIKSNGLTFQGTNAELVIVRDITERIQAELEHAQRLVELEAINRVSGALRTARTLEEMLPILLDETLEVLNTSVGSVWLFDPASGDLRKVVSRGWFNNFVEPQHDLKVGIGGMVFSTGEMYITPDFNTDPLTRPEIRGLIPEGWGGACIPIYNTTERVGIFYLGVPSTRALQPTEIHLLVNLSEIAGNAIHRMRLHAQSELHVQRLNALRIFDMAITSSLDLRLTLDVLLEQAVGQLGVDAADVLLFNEQSNLLEFAAGRGFRTNAVQHTRARLGEGLAGQVALGRSSLAIADLAQASGSSQAWLTATEKFKSYTGVPLISKGNLEGVLELFHREKLLPNAEWKQFLEDLARQAAIAIDNGQLFERLQRSNSELELSYDIFIEGLSRTLEQRHLETHNHCHRVTDLTLELAAEMNAFRDEDIVSLRRGTILHDIGKLGVPDEILLKKGKLTDDEWLVMRKHPDYAHELLVPMNFAGPSVDIPYCHHERWDGSGYPRGLKGEQIPLAARIFAVVDVWDALTNDRVYSTAWEPRKVRDYIGEQSGAHFDPRVVAAFLSYYDSGRLNGHK